MILWFLLSLISFQKLFFILPANANVGISSVGKIREKLSNDEALKNEDLLYKPASTSKVFTAMTALSELGENFRFETKIIWKTNRLDTISDVMVIGGGDPTWELNESRPFDQSPFKGFIEFLKKRGIRKILGEIKFSSKHEGLNRRGSLSHPQKVMIPSGWNEKEKEGEYLRRDDGFGIIPGSFNYRLMTKSGDVLENAEKFYVEKFGCSDEYPTEEEEKYRNQFPHVYVDCNKTMQWDDELKNKKNGPLTAIQWNEALQKYIYAAKKNNSLYLKSSIVPLTLKGTVMRLKQHLTDFLSKESIEVETVTAININQILPYSVNDQFTIQSEPLLDLLSVFMKYSINRIGESLVPQIGLKRIEKHRLNSVDAYQIGVLTIQKTAENLAFNGGFQQSTERMQIKDGCGLSRLSVVTPRFMTSVLSGIYKNKKLFNLFQKISAVSGSEGTLKHSTSDRLKGKMIGKTGTLNDVYNLVGFVKNDHPEPQNEYEWIPFSIFSDDFQDRKNYTLKIVSSLYSTSTKVKKVASLLKSNAFENNLTKDEYEMLSFQSKEISNELMDPSSEEDKGNEWSRENEANDVLFLSGST